VTPERQQEIATLIREHIIYLIGDVDSEMLKEVWEQVDLSECKFVDAEVGRIVALLRGKT
jgi:hypothetical protein